MMAIARSDTNTVDGRIDPIAAAIASIFGMRAAGSCAMSRPSMSFTWLAKMITAMPVVKPTVTGKGMYAQEPGGDHDEASHRRGEHQAVIA